MSREDASPSRKRSSPAASSPSISEAGTSASIAQTSPSLADIGALLRTELSGTNSAIAFVQQAVEAQNTRIEEIKRAADALGSRVEDMSAKADIEYTIIRAEMDTKVTAVDHRVVDAEESVARLEQDMQANLRQVEEQFRGESRRLEEQMATLKKQEVDAAHNQQVHWKEVQTLRATIGELERAPPAGAPQPVRWGANAAEWDRDEDPCVARIAFRSSVPKENVHNMVADDWLCHANLATGTWTLQGPPLGKKFVVLFSAEGGSNRMAAKRMGSAFAALREVSGAWRKLGTDDVDGRAQPGFVAPDQNGRSIAVSISTRRLQVSLQKLYTQRQWHADKISGVLSSGWVPAVRALPDDTTRTIVLQFDVAAARELGIDVEEVRKAYVAAAPSAAQKRAPTWV